MSKPIIKLGSKGEAVVTAQKALICRGYLAPIHNNGTFGPNTLRAVLNYQDDRGAGNYWAFSFPLKLDGIVGPQTWFRLWPETVKKGSKEMAVQLLQEILKSYGYPEYDPGPIDGIFGPLTDAAVRAFQGDYYDCDGKPLKVDGIAGNQTWAALWS